MAKGSPISIAFGKALRQERIKKGISQVELSERCNLDRSYISQIERGLKNPTLFVISVIAKHLQISLITLIEETVDHLPLSEQKLMNKFHENQSKE